MINKNQKANNATTQNFLKIATIEDGFVILKDGGVRLILMCTPLNFALKSETEQNAIIAEYQNFLNALEFPIQILIQSKTVDLTSYLQQLEERRLAAQNPLLERQILDYMEFIRKLVQIANIVDKKFFIIISWQNPVTETKGFLAKFRAASNQKIPLDETKFQEAKRDLTEKAKVVASALASMGIQAVQLNTKELIELFYQTYNPELSLSQKLIDPQSLTSTYISREK